MSSKTIISQLKPFSARRFDACMNYLMHEYGASTLDQHDITKLHVMIDFFHVLETGKQVIGGELAPWKHTSGALTANALKDLPRTAQLLAEEMPTLARRLQTAGIRIGE
ncbi:MAG: hypothetical protein AAF085_10050, partial [Planctomycetota bacterium]